MGFLAPFVLGLIAGGAAVWELNRRQFVQDEQPSSLEDNADALQQEDQSLSDASGSAMTLDNLTTINGIGTVYAQRLQTAGIQTFAQLAELAPEQITAIVSQGKSENLINVHRWIKQAKELAESQGMPV